MGRHDPDMKRRIEIMVTRAMNYIILRWHGWERRTESYAGTRRTLWKDPKTGYWWVEEAAIQICERRRGFMETTEFPPSFVMLEMRETVDGIFIMLVDKRHDYILDCEFAPKKKLLALKDGLYQAVQGFKQDLKRNNVV